MRTVRSLLRQSTSLLALCIPYLLQPMVVFVSILLFIFVDVNLPTYPFFVVNKMSFLVLIFDADPALPYMRRACFDYFKLGGVAVSGPIGLISGYDIPIFFS